MVKQLERRSSAHCSMAPVHMCGATRPCAPAASKVTMAAWSGEQGADEASALVVGASNGNLHVSLERDARF